MEHSDRLSGFPMELSSVPIDSVSMTQISIVITKDFPIDSLDMSHHQSAGVMC